MNNKAIDKYLANHAEPESQLIDFIQQDFHHVLLIPAYDESDTLLKLLDQKFSGLQGSLLIILVINAHEKSASVVIENNEKLLIMLEINYKKINSQKHLYFYKTQQGALLVIDRNEPGQKLQSTQGVGQARKIAADCAVRLYAEGRLKKPWLHNTDADVILPQDYFSRLELKEPHQSALIYPFKHLLEGNALQQQAMVLYEKYLHYYQQGLQRANSPYAYCSIGSTITCHVLSYAQVRGFPKKNAGEDFYLLNKLAKVGKISSLQGEPILIRGRLSARTPFGTGPTLSQLLTLKNLTQDYRVYDPKVFNYLRVLIQSFTALEKITTSSVWITAMENFLQCNDTINRPLLIEILQKMNFQQGLKHALKQSPARFLEHMHSWFDGFRTLKFIHHLRDSDYPCIPITQALGVAQVAVH